MPTPGSTAIAASISNTPYAIQYSGNNVDVTLRQDSETVQRIAAGMHAGWTSATPSATTTMAATIPAAFAGMVNAGQGLEFITALGIGIDYETQLWANSWSAPQAQHNYTPQKSSIVNAIQDASPIWSSGCEALANKVADAFLSAFVQEVG
tara:strand:- start:30198 stop:30650 length:453 start_codon:yes stop_codon:yes gene_type:complete